MALDFHRNQQLHWVRSRQRPGLEWAFEIVNPVTKQWKLLVRLIDSKKELAEFDISGEMMQNTANIQALVGQAHLKILLKRQERTDAIRQQRIASREAEWQRELTSRREGPLSAGDERQSEWSPEDDGSEASSESFGSGGDRISSNSADSEDNRPSPERLQSESAASSGTPDSPRPRRGRPPSKGRDLDKRRDGGA